MPRPMYARSHEVGPLPGACELLRYLTEADVPWAIATSSRMETAKPTLAALGVDRERAPVVTRDQVRRAKPDPDLFFAAAERLSADITPPPWSWATASGTCSPLAALCVGRRAAVRRLRAGGT
jgi:beta-phosphoglucomutase-like phosphatase (HAD superfamily)